MKKFLKIISIILFFICFLELFLCPRTVYADFKDDSYNAITTYRDFIQSEQNAILSQFFTYNYVGLSVVRKNGTTVDYRVNVVVTGSTYSSESYYSYIYYTVGEGSYYYTSDDGFLFPHSFSGRFTLRLRNDVAESIYFLGHSYFFSYSNPDNFDPLYLITYCDLTNGYYTNSHDGTSLQRVHLFTLPNSFLSGIISTPSLGDTFGDSIDKSIESVSPVPVVTTAPPFQPPATVPPETLPPEIVTIYPPSTDLDGSYIIDYQPYIYGGFTPITTIQDDTIITASGSIISYSWDMLTADEQIKSIILLILVLSLVLGLLT